MNIMGAGPAELVLVFIIMLVVAGPKRMIQWSYTLGQYVAKLREMFQETMNAVRKEFEDAGVDIRKDLPTVPQNFNVLNEVSKVINEPPKSNDSTPPAASTPENAPTETPTDKQDNSSPYDSWLPK